MSGHVVGIFKDAILLAQGPMGRVRHAAEGVAIVRRDYDAVRQIPNDAVYAIYPSSAATPAKLARVVNTVMDMPHDFIEVRIFFADKVAQVVRHVSAQDISAMKARLPASPEVALTA